MRKWKVQLKGLLDKRRFQRTYEIDAETMGLASLKASKKFRAECGIDTITFLRSEMLKMEMVPV